MMEKRIAERLSAAIQAGELPSSYPAEAGARHAVNTMLSLAARARLGSSREDLLNDAASATAMVPRMTGTQ